MLLAVMGTFATRPYLRRCIFTSGIHVDALIQAKGGYRPLSVFIQKFLKSINEGTSIRVLARGFGCLVDCTCTEEFKSFMPILARLDKVARVACVQNGQDVTLNVLMPEQVFCFVPSRSCTLAKSSVLQQGVVTEASCELETLLLVVEDAMAGVVYDKEIVRPVVVADKIADIAVELVLGFLSDIEFDDAGVVVEAFTEQSRKLSGLCLVRSDPDAPPALLLIDIPRRQSSVHRVDPPT